MKRRIELAKENIDNLSIRCRCLLLSLTRSTVYYASTNNSVNDVDHMNEIREIYEQYPFKGYKRIADDLSDKGFVVNHKRVYRLMKFMGLQAVYPKKNLSKRRQNDIVYPYLLKARPAKQVHDCWCVDITYIKIAHGYVYLTALIDAVSRCIMGWHVSPYLVTDSCLDALEMAISTGYKPRIINSDQGCQFTSQEWAYSLSLLKIDISMDGKGRCLDNIPIERFWRTIKYEEVYLKTYESVLEAREELRKYISWYNHERRHSGIGKKRPYEVMSGIEYKIKQQSVEPMANRSLKIAA
jgi:putative transposase